MLRSPPAGCAGAPRDGALSRGGAADGPRATTDGSRVNVVLRNAVHILTGDLGGELLTAVAIGLAAARLGPAEFGTLAEAQAFFEPFAAFFGFGLGSVAVAVAAGTPGGATGAVRGTVEVVRVSLASVGLVVGLAAAAVTGRSSLLPILAVVAVGEVVLAYWNAARLPFQVAQRMDRLRALPFVASLVRLGTAFAAARWLCSPVGFQLSGLAGGLATAALFTLAGRSWYPARRRFDRAFAARLLRTAWPMAIEAGLAMLYLRAPYLFLHDAAPVVRGEYAAADRLLRPLLGVAMAIAASALPTLAAMASGGERDALRTALRTALPRVVLALTGVFIVAWPLVEIALPRLAPAYAGAVGPFRALLAGVLCMFVNALARSLLMALGRFRALLGVSAATAVLFVVVTRSGLVACDAVGAALALSLVEASATVALLLLAARTVGIGGGDAPATAVDAPA